ncbi:hypothetical protein EDC27_0965 [Desulfosoma caldarium]|uniref:Uncharacterized protein n=1 Tax=Desulfosoma caldarium TaxID=610254 RepID=A0A3N1VIB6_9BACT|nr:hypothetical protein EDC27_0965 [Desulfosoma caldarium]
MKNLVAWSLCSLGTVLVQNEPDSRCRTGYKNQKAKHGGGLCS